MSRWRYARRRAVWAAAACATFLLMGIVPGNALAKVSVCRGDPIIYLSNGKQVDMVVTFTADPYYVNKIVYSLVLPSNVKVTQIAYTGSPFLGKESVTGVYTNQTNTYDLTTTVTTTSAPFTVTASDSILYTSSRTTITQGSASGSSGTGIKVHLVG